MNRYKVEVCKSPNWQRHRIATLGISMESPNWRGDKLAAILDFVASRFDEVRIDVADALYQHKFMSAGINEEEARAGAEALGALWLTQHQDLLDSCSIPKRIVRWGEWYKHSLYEETYKSFKEAFRIDSAFHAAVDEDVQNFYARQKKKWNEGEFLHSIDFFVEEATVLSLQAKELSSVRLYPGEELTCMKAVRAGISSNVPTWLKNEQFAQIRLKVRDCMKPKMSTQDDLQMIA